MTTWTQTPAAASAFVSTTPAGDAYVNAGYVIANYVTFDWEPVATASTAWT